MRLRLYVTREILIYLAVFAGSYLIGVAMLGCVALTAPIAGLPLPAHPFRTIAATARRHARGETGWTSPRSRR